jgi:hypothetical protein
MVYVETAREIGRAKDNASGILWKTPARLRHTTLIIS